MANNELIKAAVKVVAAAAALFTGKKLGEEAYKNYKTGIGSNTSSKK